MEHRGQVVDIARRTVVVCYGFFLVGYFLLPERRFQYLLYYLLVLLPFLLFCLPACQDLWRRSVVIRWAGVFALYMSASSIWSEPTDPGCIAFITARSLLTLSFLLITTHLAVSSPDQFGRLLRYVIPVVALSGLVSAVLFYADFPFPAGRMMSFGQIDNPNGMGVVHAIFTLLAAAGYFDARKKRHKVLFAISWAAIFSVLLLTQSRNGFIAGIAGFGLLLWYKSDRKRHLAVLSILAVLLMFYLGNPIQTRLLDKRITVREDIWHAAVEQIREAPWLGHGACTAMVFPSQGVTYTDPHSAYLTAAWAAGLPGLGLLLGLYVQAFRSAWRAFRVNGRALYPALVVTSTLCLLPDFGSVLTRPREPWLFVWLPLALATAAQLQPRLRIGAAAQ